MAMRPSKGGHLEVGEHEFLFALDWDRHAESCAPQRPEWRATPSDPRILESHTGARNLTLHLRIPPLDLL